MQNDENKKKKLTFRVIAILIIVIAVLLIVLMSLFIVKQQKTIEEQADKAWVVENASATISVDVLTSSIQEIGELATVKYVYTNAAQFTDSKQIKDFDIPLTKKSFIVKWDGVIKAGVDVEKIDVTVNELKEKIVIELPQAKILSHELDEDSLETLDETNNIFNQITVDDVNSFIGENKTFMEERAVENGLLEDAEDNAKILIKNFLESMGNVSEDYTVKINFVEDDESN